MAGKGAGGATGRELKARRRAGSLLFGVVAVAAVAGAMTVQSPAHGAPPQAQGWTPAPRPTAVVTGPTSGPTGAGPTTSGAAGAAPDPADASTAAAGADEPAGGPADGPVNGCPAATGGAITRAPGTGRTVALTFDDGPGDDTPALLDLLRERGVPATFFLVGGNAATHPGLVARTAAEGHLVGDHSWAHRLPRQVAGGWTRAFLQHDLSRTADVLTRESGRPVCWFRPPGGFLPPAVLPVAHGLGMRVALWSVDPRDWALQDPHGTGATLTRAQLADRIVARVSAGLGEQHPIVLLHDGGGPRAATVAAVGRIIDLYRTHGYRFVRLDGVGAD